MSLAQSSVKRAVDASGDDVRTFDDGGVEVTGAVLVGDAGEHVGIDTDPIITSPRSRSKSSTGGALEASHDAKNVAGTFFSATAVFAGQVAPMYIMVFDLAAPPINGNVPVLRRTADSGIDSNDEVHGAEVSVPEGLAMANGIQVAVSQTPATLTLLGADVAYDVFFL